MPGVGIRNLNELISRLMLIAAIALVVGPILVFLSYGFYDVVERQIVYVFSFDNFIEFVATPSYRGIFFQTLRLAAEIGLINTFVGFWVAYFIWRSHQRYKHMLLLAAAVPLLMSYIIKIYALRSMMGFNGIINGTLLSLGMIDEPIEAFLFNMTAVRVTLSIVLLPFAILPTFVAMERIPSSLLSASADLGASVSQTFWKIVLPMAVPGLALALTFTFVLAAGDFLVPELVGGVNGFTFGRLIFTQFGLSFNWPLGAALSAVLLLISLALIAVAQRLSNPAWQDNRG